MGKWLVLIYEFIFLSIKNGCYEDFRGVFKAPIILIWYIELERESKRV